jgi:hypothetical protein
MVEAAGSLIGSGARARSHAKLPARGGKAGMVIFLGLVIVSGVLGLSAIVVLFALASETEVLPSLTRAGAAGDDEPPASLEDRHSGQGISSRARPPDAGILRAGTDSLPQRFG